jgi:ketosteroid isomerase-like protein
MLGAELEMAELEKVRGLERRRIELTRTNDADALAPLLDESLIYVNSADVIYDKPGYLRKIRTNCLSYDEDFDVRETEVRVFDDLIIFAGVMLGHSRLEGEQQVLHFRCLAVWRKDRAGWRMVAWQASSGSLLQ